MKKSSSFIGINDSIEIFEYLKNNVLDEHLCTHCGTCVGLSNGTLEFKQTEYGPLPSRVVSVKPQLPEIIFSACPGIGVNYAKLNAYVFGEKPENKLIGQYQKFYVGYALDSDVRRRGASAGVITQTLSYFLENKLIDGAVVLRHGYPKPWLSTPIIATSKEEILASSQSVYTPTSVNSILADTEHFNGKLAYVGLPDQVASLRYLQTINHSAANKVKFILGPYVGTIMYLRAVESFLRSHGIHHLNDIANIRYREGEWPGHLHIETCTGKIIKSNKFYYNYLIPFYITYSSIFSIDFTNELSDISVGDAWAPHYENLGEGYSVVVARNEKAVDVLRSMVSDGQIYLEEIRLDDAISMHGHMLDFKKRGTFIRLGWRKILGKPVPDYGFLPVNIPFTRVVVEIFISGIFSVCRTKFARRLIEFIPLSFIGPLFDVLRKTWKSVSKPTKRKGLQELEFINSEPRS